VRLRSPPVIPLKDHNPTRHFPYVTILLIAVNVGVYFLVQRPFEATPDDQITFSYSYAAVPCELVEGRALTVNEIRQTLRGDDTACVRESREVASTEYAPNKQVYLAVIYSMFLHGSLLHLGGNMLFLWVFGNNIEDRMRTVPYILFYAAAGFAATVAHVLAQPDSTVPVIGASGAVAGVMGAYLVLFPNVQIRSLIIFFFILFRDIPAKWLLGLWFVSQFFINPNAGVAWVAHVGGFVFGAAIAFLLRERLRPSHVPMSWS
jgi:membrane associated rhomboid family serine protease